jgi:hypothetical protein
LIFYHPGLFLRLFLLFLFSFISNATPFFGASYTFFATTELVNMGFNLESFALVVFVSALGATLGKIPIYAGAFGLQKNLQKNKNVKLLGTWLGKSGFYLALFITALIPALPLDDYVYIGAGANRAKLTPMLGVTFIAKLAKSAFEILLEFTGLVAVTPFFHHFLGLSRLELAILLSGVFIVLGVVIYKIDWESIVVWAEKVFGRHPKSTQYNV